MSQQTGLSRASLSPVWNLRGWGGQCLLLAAWCQALSPREPGDGTTWCPQVTWPPGRPAALGDLPRALARSRGARVWVVKREVTLPTKEAPSRVA